MNMHKLREGCALLGVMILLVVFSPSNAFSWGAATHAYVDNKIGKTVPLKNLNEIYGGMANDIFNFDPDVLVPNTKDYYLYVQTHYNTLALWSEAQSSTNFGKALAFGFASHANGQLWGTYANVFAGADFIAHGPGGNDAGYYVIDKAMYFWENVLKPLGIISDESIGLSVSHNLIEFAIDIMVAYETPGRTVIGKKIMESVLFRSPEFPLLLVKAYAEDLSTTFGISRLEADKIIISKEREFRKTMFMYGQGLSQKSEEEAINYMASLLAQLGSDVYGITVDPLVVANAITAAQGLCRSDYASAIQQTVDFVIAQMQGAGISY